MKLVLFHLKMTLDFLANWWQHTVVGECGSKDASPVSAGFFHVWYVYPPYPLRSLPLPFALTQALFLSLPAFLQTVGGQT